MTKSIFEIYFLKKDLIFMNLYILVIIIRTVFYFHIYVLGKQRYLRLIPVGALDGQDVEWTKVADTKGCITFCTMCIHSNGSSLYLFCSAVKKQVRSLQNIPFLYSFIVCLL